MNGQIEDVIKAFNQAWLDLHCPPVRLLIDEKEDKSAAFFAINGEVHINPNIIPKGCDPYKYLLWYFRHELAHIHHCPYDLRTAYSLEKAAYDIVGDWDLAYLATHLFADLQININYLPRRFEELPYFMRVVGHRSSTLLEYLLQEVYIQVNPIRKSSNKTLENVAKELLAVTLLDKPWHTKVQMIAIIFSKLRTIHPGLFSERRMGKYLREDMLWVREDFLPSSMRAFEEILGKVSNSSDAEKFFRQWIEPRLPPEEKEKARRIIEAKIKTQKRDESGKSKEKMEEAKRGGSKRIERMERINVKSPEKPSPDSSLLEEPYLPSSLSKPYEKISSIIFEEAFWKRFWYKSRAENIIMQYLSENPTRRPVWAVVKYPDDWYIEDEIEELDIDVSLDEGPLIPEVTTLKWVEEPTFHGQSLITGFVPSAMVILDASLSMLNVHDDASIAAFIAYLSAYKAGGQTAVITFSTRYISADWNSPSDLKELTLSMRFDEYTIFPTHEVKKLLSGMAGNCFIVIITDGGWQNIDEAIPVLESIANLGHKIVIFLLPGGKYPDKISLISKSPHLKVYNVNKPERDLQGLVLSESIRTYRTFLT
ncbi:MAG: VWA domain-containing protein [Candidatus Bathyarchaeia archaeon]